MATVKSETHNDYRPVRARNVCPHCEEPAFVRTSKRVTATLREKYMQCSNLECAHTWVIHEHAVRTIAPSMCPNPSVHIPLSPNSPVNKPDPTAQGALDLGAFNPRPVPAK